MNHLRKPSRLVFLVVLSVVAMVSVATRSEATGVIGKEDLAGPWQLSLMGEGGCGVETILVTFTLNSVGSSSNATLMAHSAGCGNTTVTAQTFTISTLSSNGSGTAGLSCGSGCGFTFHIQVSPDRTQFNLVDIIDPANFWHGVAIHQ